MNSPRFVFFLHAPYFILPFVVRIELIPPSVSERIQLRPFQVHCRAVVQSLQEDTPTMSARHHPLRVQVSSSCQLDFSPRHGRPNANIPYQSQRDMWYVTPSHTNTILPSLLLVIGGIRLSASQLSASQLSSPIAMTDISSRTMPSA